MFSPIAPSMTSRLLFPAFLLLAILWTGCGDKPEPRAGADSTTARRIITLGGPITEIVQELGLSNEVVGVDASSQWADSAHPVAKLSYQRAIAAEGVLALRPTLVLGTSESGPPSALEQIRSAGVRVVQVKTGYTVEAALHRVDTIAALLGVPERGAQLRERMKARLASLPAAADTPRVLFIYGRSPGSMQVAGRETAADAVVGLAGGRNTVTEYTGYKPITPEAVLAAKPEVIVMTASGLQANGGIDGLLRSQPALLETPAGKARRIVAMDDNLLLGFGPRLGDAVHMLHGLLRGTAAAADSTMAGKTR